ncbi:YgdI/YgdR family lipoprotein [Endozoicomonas sp. SM1973]|uniref:YgdI/YgdR family lipoprotein n=1 Tax=Spartinivicinus marinus TaxID=2994442 RepID=A0A853IFF0_9GAMM|nr:YgdI/YgdR family lipoprotein [Spartinivicinus marinus]MCX4025985.1 YgdI/YgdR family lipoprotein [Spartinivicinus marinus]NYZ67885.1 YgdI/YgdR family lipoprotein [Spartinivicinus marinus]
MKKVLLSLSLVILAGCANPKIIQMKDGSTIETTDNVFFDEETEFYWYINSKGRKKSINKDEVISIEDM